MSSGDAVVALLEKKPEIGREIAVNLYKNGEVSLWKASEIARMNLEEFKDVFIAQGYKNKGEWNKRRE